ncbi:hypothetical protein BD413DRAFT_613804 [Trametes elegans]|nr:hypothetical protein BD413DRAFT_613804 [Trametes elegans]
MSSETFIVVFKDGVSQAEIDKFANDVNENGGQVKNRYDSVLRGFSAAIPESFLLRLQSFQGSVIDYIEPDSTVTTQ